MDDFVSLINALSPILCAIIGIISYATLTNFRLDRLDEQVKKIDTVENKVTDLDKRVTVLENKVAK